MRELVQHSKVWLAWGVLCSTANTAWAQPPEDAAQRLRMRERQTLPQAQAALRRQQRDCDTQLAVLHVRQAMAQAENSTDTSSWHGMEVLTAQCQVRSQQLRDQVTQLEVEQAQLRQTLENAARTQP